MYNALCVDYSCSLLYCSLLTPFLSLRAAWMKLPYVSHSHIVKEQGNLESSEVGTAFLDARKNIGVGAGGREEG